MTMHRKRNPLWKDANKQDRNRQTSKARLDKLNTLAQKTGFYTWAKLTTAALNGQAVILTTAKVYAGLDRIREGSLDFGDGLQGLVYATIYDVAKELGLSQEQAEYLSREQD